MKKLRFAALAALLPLSGCEKKQTLTAPASLFETEGGVTSLGIQEGDSPEAFQEAYGDYSIQVAYENTGYTPMSIDRIPYDSNLITLLRLIHVNMHQNDENQDDYPAAVDSEDLRKPCCIIEHRNKLRTFSAFPRTTLEPCDYTDCDIVHHEGEKCLIRVPFRLEECRDESPESSCDSC